MTLDANPFVAQADSYGAEQMRRAFSTFINSGGGVVGANDLQVTALSTPNMSVNVSSGQVWVPGTISTQQGQYYGLNNATLNVLVPGSDPTYPRIDLIAVVVDDAAYGQSSTGWDIVDVEGIAAASPTIPTAPANSIVLAQIAVGAAVSTITSADITDVRPIVGLVVNGTTTFSGPIVGFEDKGSQVFNVKAYGAKGDTITRTDGATTAGSTTLNSASGTFASTDVGKDISVVGAASNATLTTALVSGTSYTSLAVTPLVTGITSGANVVLQSGSSTQTFVTSASAAVGATSLAVTSLAANAAYPIGTLVDAATLSATISSVQSATQITMSVAASVAVSGTSYTYGTDDTAAIQAALNTANANAGGVVLFPPGNYSITAPLVFYSKVNMWGSGIETTIITRATSSNTIDVVQSYDVVALEGTNSTGGVYNFTIKDLTIDGGGTGTTGYGLRIYGLGYILQNLRIRNMPQSGIRSEWSSTPTPTAPDSMEAQIINVKVHNNGSDGITWLGPHDSQVVNVIAYSNTGIGFNFVGTGNGIGTIVINAHAYANTGGSYVLGVPTTLIQCISDEAGSTNGVVIGAVDCQMIGGAIFGMTTGNAITLGYGGTASGTIIRGVSVRSVGYALYVISDGGNNVIDLSTTSATVLWTANTTISASTKLDIRTSTSMGPQPSPTVPASTVGHLNTFSVPMSVVISGGTVTAIAINGTDTGLTSGTVPLLPGQTITLTYSAVPTWVWIGN